MEAISQEAGPEWEYLAKLGETSKYLRFEYDSFYISVQRLGDQPGTKVDSIQLLRYNQGMYVLSDVFRFSYDRLRGLIGSDHENFDLGFEAYEGAELGGVVIPDAESFRRLLLAINHLGLAVPQSAIDDLSFPPLLRFFARPKDNPEPELEEFEPVGYQLPEPRQRPRHRLYARDYWIPHSGSRSNSAPEGHQDTPAPEDAPPVEDTPEMHGVREDTPSPEDMHDTSVQDVSLQDVSMQDDTPPRAVDDVSVRLQRSSIESPQRSETSFLAAPPEPQRQPLTFDERIQEDEDWGMSNDLDDVHKTVFHDLYSDIAGIDREMRNPADENDAYTPPYSNISLPPHQRYPTGWILGQSNRILYYLADKVGMGKTFAAIEAMVRTMLIVSIGVAIEKERAHLPSLLHHPLHIHDEAHPRFGKNTACRADTLKLYGIRCPCNKETATYKVTKDGHFSPGYMLVIVPVILIPNMMDSINRFIRPSVRLPHNQQPIRVINIHEGVNYGEKLKVFINGSPEHFGLGTIVIAPATNALNPSVQDLCKNTQRILKTQPSFICIDEVHSIGNSTHLSAQLVRTLVNRAKSPVHVLALSGTPWRNGPNDFDVIQSIALDKFSIVRWYGREVYDDYEHRLTSARANLNNTTKQVGRLDIIGRGKQGSFQGDEKTEAHNLLIEHDRFLHEYVAQIPLLQRKEGSRYLGYYVPLRRPGSEKTDVQVKYYDIGMTDTQKQVANNYKEYLRVTHRNEVRTWSKKPKDKRGERPKIKTRLFNLDSGASDNNTRTDVSLVGFAPGTAQHVLKRTEQSEMQFRSPEANEVFKRTTTENQREAVKASRYWGLAQSAFYTGRVDPKTGHRELSPKVQFICWQIQEMLNDKEPHMNGQQSLGVFQKKMVIVVPHAFQGLLLIAFLFQQFPGHNFTFVGAANESSKERPALLAPFQRSTLTKHPEDGKNGDPIALISTYGMMGVGLNLIRCNYLISTSPLPNKANQDQVFGRIDRQGQYATTHCYVLLDRGNPVDFTTYHRMQKRTALTVPPEEAGSALNFLLEGIEEEDEREPEADSEMGEAS